MFLLFWEVYREILILKKCGLQARQQPPSEEGADPPGLP